MPLVGSWVHLATARQPSTLPLAPFPAGERDQASGPSLEQVGWLSTANSIAKTPPASRPWRGFVRQSHQYVPEPC
jgi:hypothetical protein